MLQRFVVLATRAKRYTLINILYVHAEHGVLLSTWSVRLTALRRDVSVPRKSKSANQKQSTIFVDIYSQSQNCDASKCWRSVFGLATDDTDVSTLLLKASWRHQEVELRTG